MNQQSDVNKNVNLTINGQSVTVPEGTSILEAAKKVNVNIPTLCEHPDLCSQALCRICAVECDGRVKLVAACANNVWEGVNIVTNNFRLLEIRKTILELILADHPQDCLSCVQNKNCKLQSLAMEFGIYTSSFSRSVMHCLPSIENKTIVRDMSKCIKCGRCVDVCQEVQAIRAINTSGRSHDFTICTPYKQALEDTPCVFCGGCVQVCPVGAIYEYDQNAEVLDNLADSGRHVIAQVSTAFVSALNDELGFAEKTITAGKVITAIKQFGFDQVFDSAVAVNIRNSQLYGELEKRIKSKGSLPLISGSSEGALRFVERFYPDLAAHLAPVKTPRRIFAEKFKSLYAAAKGLDISNITTVSFVSCISQKYGTGTADFALNAAEFARMIKLAGIDIAALLESLFDSIDIEHTNQDNRTDSLIVRSFAEAHGIMQSIRKGECPAQVVEIEVNT